MTPRAWRLTVMFLGSVAVPASGQEPRNCDLAESRVARPIAQPDDTYIVFVSQPVFRCTDGAEIRADSAALYEATGFSQFFRSVYFRDGTRTLRADAARYFDGTDRLLADGSVRLMNETDGTEITGENMVLLRAGARRDEDWLEMRGGSPHARFTPRPAPVEPDPTPEDGAVGDTASMPAEPAPADTVTVPREPRPIELDAFKIVLVGDRLVHASGRVRVTQDSLVAYGDSMAYTRGEGILELFENARMIAPGGGSDTLDLRGDTIVARMPSGNLEEVEARRRGQLFGAEVAIVGPRVRVHFSPTDEVERIVSVLAPVPESLEEEDAAGTAASDSIAALAPPPERPEASAEEYVITADSIEISTPGGEIETLFGAGQARAVSTARDTLNVENTPELLKRDWIEGNQIIAYFISTDSVSGESEEADPAEGRYRIQRIVATGAARSLSRFRPDSAAADSAASALSANYVRGDEIRIFLVDGEADRMEVDNAEGIVIQPEARTRGIQADSTLETRPDTTRSTRSPALRSSRSGGGSPHRR
jgi:lipopolysaccharide export system protein LptA